MANEVENYAQEIIEIPSDTALLDVTFNDGGGFDSYKMLFKHAKGISIVAELLAQDMGSTTTGNIYSLIWNCSAKVANSVIIEVHCTTAGKAPGTLNVQIGSSSGGDDIMLAETLEGIFADSSWFFHVNGVTPNMLSDSDTFFFKINVPATNEFTGDIFIHARHKDV